MPRKHFIVAWLMLAAVWPAAAHNGPPFPIITDRTVGPCVLSLWTHPDVGVGTFFVIVNQPKTGTIPKDLKIYIGVQPASGRLPERWYGGSIQQMHGQLQFNYEVPFDAQEIWRVHVRVKSSKGEGEAMSQVEVTPPGLGRWDLVAYGAPFLAIGFLWFRVIVRRRGIKQESQR